MMLTDAGEDTLHAQGLDELSDTSWAAIAIHSDQVRYETSDMGSSLDLKNKPSG